MTKARRFMWTRHVACIGRMGIHRKSLLKILKGKDQFGELVIRRVVGNINI
jgi:hypothetical protein